MVGLEAKAATFQPLVGDEMVAVAKSVPGEPEESAYRPTSMPWADEDASRFRPSVPALPVATATNGQASACWRVIWSAWASTLVWLPRSTLAPPVTVTVTILEVVVLPAASLATAVREWEPLEAVLAFQE